MIFSVGYEVEADGRGDWSGSDRAYSDSEGLVRRSRKIMATYTNALGQKLIAPYP